MEPRKQLRNVSDSDSKLVEKQAAGNDFNSLKIAERSAGFFDSSFCRPHGPRSFDSIKSTKIKTRHRKTGLFQKPLSKTLSTEREHQDSSGAGFSGLRRASRGRLAKQSIKERADIIHVVGSRNRTKPLNIPNPTLGQA